MNCNSIIVFLISVIGFQKCDAQTITINSNKCYGGSGIEDYPKILFNKNLNILSLIGNSNSYLSGNKTSVLCDSLFPDIWYLKLDTSLTINFQASIGGSKKEDYPSVINNGSSFLIATTSNSDSSCQKKTSNHFKKDQISLIFS